MELVESLIHCPTQSNEIVAPLTPISQPTVMAYGCLSSGIPIFVESILVFRLLAVYPPRRTSTRIVIAVFAPLLVIKVARVVNFIFFYSTVFRKEAEADSSSSALGPASFNHPSPKIEWFLQLVDNTFVNSLPDAFEFNLFLHQIHECLISLTPLSKQFVRSQS